MKNKILLGTGSLYSYGLNRIFKLAKRAGYEGVELMLDNSIKTKSQDFNQLQKEHKLLIISVHSAMDFAHIFGNSPQERIDNSLNLAKRIRAKTLVVHPSEPYNKEYELWLRKNLKSIEQKAKPLQVLVENLPKKIFL